MKMHDIRRAGPQGRARLFALLSLLLLACPITMSAAQAETARVETARAETGAPEKPAVCRVGVDIEDLYDLNMANDTFSAILWVWTVCPSPEFAPLGTFAFPTASVGLNLSPVETVDLETGEQYAFRRVQGTFRFNWDMRHYPFDRQSITVPIDETEYGADRLLFEPDTRESFLTPDIRRSLTEWSVSDLVLRSSVSKEASTYGLPGAKGATYARLEASFTLERTNLLAFLKLTAGVYAAIFIAFLTFFYDPNDRGGFGSKLGMLVGVLFAVLLNLRTADTSIGDSGQMTLVTEIHLAALVLIVGLSMVALRDRRRIERDLPVRHPDWPMLLILGVIYLVTIAALITRSALS